MRCHEWMAALQLVFCLLTFWFVFKAVIKIEALGHTFVFDDLTRENDIDRDSEKVPKAQLFFWRKLSFLLQWTVEFDGKCVAKMYLHPDHGWPKTVTPEGREAINVRQRKTAKVKLSKATHKHRMFVLGFGILRVPTRSMLRTSWRSKVWEAWVFLFC